MPYFFSFQIIRGMSHPNPNPNQIIGGMPHPNPNPHQIIGGMVFINLIVGVIIENFSMIGTHLG